MPLSDRVRYYPAFPPAVPQRGVGCIRVTHTCATLNPPKGILPSDLHVFGLPLAFILSQDQTLLCIIVLTFVFRFQRSRSFTHACSAMAVTAMRLLFSLLAFKLSKNHRRPPPLPHAPLPSIAGAKVHLFSIPQAFDAKNFALFMVISHVDTAGRWKTVVCKRYIEKIFFEFFQSGRKGAGKTGAHLIIYKGFKDL